MLSSTICTSIRVPVDDEDDDDEDEGMTMTTAKAAAMMTPKHWLAAMLG